LNKQRYLAELQRLLVFMTEADREQTVHRYGEIFDAAGEAGEAELLNELGSPTKVAIQLSRGYEPGQLAAILPQAEAPTVPEPAPTKPSQEEPWDNLPSFELPDLDIGSELVADMPTAEPETPDTSAASAPKEDKTPETEAPSAPMDTAADIEDEPVPAAEPPEAEHAAPQPDQQEEPWRNKPKKAASPAVTRSIPLGVGIPLFILVMVALGLPLAALCVVVMAALLIPGGVGLLGAYLAAVGGLWCIGYVADAVLMFGLAFLILALGLMILWLGLWADVKLASLYVRGVGWLSGELLEGTVAEDE
jgi:uncharacterized membrane protein